MTPEELAEKHPRLYHVTDPSNWDGITKRGLLSASRLLSLFEVSDVDRAAIERRRRPESVGLTHPVHREAIPPTRRCGAAPVWWALSHPPLPDTQLNY